MNVSFSCESEAHIRSRGRKVEEAFRDALRDVYVALDSAVGELVRHVGGDTTVMLVSGDGSRFFATVGGPAVRRSPVQLHA